MARLNFQDAKKLKDQGKDDDSKILLNRKREREELLKEAQREVMELEKLKTGYTRFKQTDNRADNFGKGIVHQDYVNKKETIVTELKTIHNEKRNEYKRIKEDDLAQNGDPLNDS